jgi:hypothetical protein
VRSATGPPEPSIVQPVACGSVPLRAWFSHDEATVVPGSTSTLPLTVQNTDDVAVTVTVVPAGLRSNWITVEDDVVTIAPGEVETVPVDVAPPELPSTDPGPAVIAVRLLIEGTPDDLAAETTLEVLEFDDRRILALQPVQRARRRATFEFMVENQGNGIATCRLRLVDVTDRVDGSFDPPAVGVAPGEASLVRLRSRARRGFFRRTTRHLEFEVEAEQPGHRTARTGAAVVQPPTVPMGGLLRVAGVLAVLVGLVAAWAWVVQPEIEDAAADAVDARARELTEEAAVADRARATVVPTSVPSAATTVEEPATTVPGADTDGEPDFYRLKVESPLTETTDASFTIPDGQRFDMTDVRIENPFNDGGVATLLVNGEEVFIWSLQNVRGSQFEPAITQKRLQPGDNVTFSVRCDAVGDPFSATCSNAVNVGGLVLDVETGA